VYAGLHVGRPSHNSHTICPLPHIGWRGKTYTVFRLFSPTNIYSTCTQASVEGGGGGENTSTLPLRVVVCMGPRAGSPARNARGREGKNHFKVFLHIFSNNFSFFYYFFPSGWFREDTQPRLCVYISRDMTCSTSGRILRKEKIVRLYVRVYHWSPPPFCASLSSYFTM
jgi:hypothetical protein